MGTRLKGVCPGISGGLEAGTRILEEVLELGGDWLLRGVAPEFMLIQRAVELLKVIGSSRTGN